MPIWDKIETLAEEFKKKFSDTSQTESTHDNNGWENHIYSGQKYRRAHVEIVDYRQTYNIYILHCTIFPHFNDPSPIWGFDAVCGPSKITGAFHDLSASGDQDHYMIEWFSEQVKNYKWKKPRELPNWAKEIFSKNMIAAGNIREGAELDDLCNIASTSLDFYLSNIGEIQTLSRSYRSNQNRYCYYQKQNPHVIKSMVTMGVPEPEMKKFVEEILFPEFLNKGFHKY